ncbi:MAG TPA: cupin domain-containing protein [Chitinophagales bacterium]|nr:cupin domain-containing protein [Chitinophagales bacterium]
METTISNPGVISSREGKKMNVLGHDVTVKLHSADANNHYVFEIISPAGNGVPPHVHEDEDEVIYVMSGELEVMIGDRKFKASAGDYLNFVRHVPHAFMNVGSLPAKTLWYISPGEKFEEFFDQLSVLSTSQPDMQKVVELFAQYGMTVLQ